MVIDSSKTLLTLNLTLGALLFNSCGAGSTKSHLKDSGESKPFLIVMSGFNTCDVSPEHGNWHSPMGTIFRKYADNIAQSTRESSGREFDIFLSCFTTMGELRYAESFDGFKKLHTEQKSDDVRDHLHAIISDRPNTFIIGHSYGGWLAMKTALIRHQSHEHIRSLVTIDPISRRNCRLELPGNWGDCTTSPRDFSDKDLAVIRDRTGRWNNYWEDRTVVLHSTEIELADENVKIDLGHAYIDDAPEIWDYKLEAIRSELGVKPGDGKQKGPADLIAAN